MGTDISLCTLDGSGAARLISKEITVWDFVENIAQRIFRNQRECIEDVGADFFEDVIPIFVEEAIGRFAQQLVSVVQVLEVEDEPVENDGILAKINKTFAYKVPLTDSPVYFKY